METLFDLPAHPLMVHFPVVAIPALAVLGLVMAVRADFRDRYAKPVVLLAIVTTAATFMAARSGEALAESIQIKDEFIDPHRDLGNTLRLFVLGLTVAIGGMLAVNKRSAATGRDPLAIASAALVVGLSLLSLVWTVRTGHEGAKSVWEGVISSDDDASADDNPTIETAAETTPSETDAPAVSAESTTTDVTTTTTATEDTVTSETTQAPETSETTTAPETSETTTAPIVDVDGQDVYESNCARCHGAEGGGGRGPSLQGLAVDQPDTALAVEQVQTGGGGMPAFAARLDDAEIQAAIDYIYATF